MFETGVDHGVLFPMKDGGTYDKGVAWNGLTAVNEAPTGGESTAIYADNIKYLEITSAEDFAATVEAYTYPDEFGPCIGEEQPVKGMTITQQKRKKFGMAYRTLVGNDVDGNDYGKKLHVVYGAQAKPSEQSHTTVNEDPEAMTLSWELTTTPATFKDDKYKPTAHLVFDSTTLGAEKFKKIEDKIYGSESGEPTLPTPDEFIELLQGE